MKRTVIIKETKLTYELERKPVKNINLRIRRDGSVYVSANHRISADYIDSFVISKGDIILKALASFQKLDKSAPEKRPITKEYDEECKALFAEILAELYPLLEPYGVPMPALRIREMKTRWGSCIPSKRVITLNKRLLETPRNCVEYVVLHELCHFIHPNHSKQFYAFLEKLMPDWKERKFLLSEKGNVLL